MTGARCAQAGIVGLPLAGQPYSLRRNTINHDIWHGVV
jgi:hypothetical protein